MQVGKSKFNRMESLSLRGGDKVDPSTGRRQESSWAQSQHYNKTKVVCVYEKNHWKGKEMSSPLRSGSRLIGRKTN